MSSGADGERGQPDVGDGIRVIAVGGALDGLVERMALTEALDRCVEARRHVVLDLSETQFVDSLGLTLVVSAHERLREVGCAIVVLRPPTRGALLAIAGLDGVLPIASSDAQARRLLKRSIEDAQIER